jgi:alpha-beta hydrolase superfamily lysophospholipase
MTQTLRNTEERIEGANGLSPFVRSWRPEGAVRGVLAIIPGFNAQSGYYAWAPSL